MRFFNMIPFFSLAVGLVCCLFAATELNAATLLPTVRLDISFSLDKNLLHGNAQIEIPANLGTSVELGNLHISQISLNSKPVQLSGEETSITLLPEAVIQKLLITYDKQFPPKRRNAGGVVAPDGITLFGIWHPLLHGEAMYRLTAEIPADFEAISEAEEIFTSPSTSGKILRFRFQHPTEAINFVAGPYVVTETPFGNNQMLYTYFFKEDQELAATFRDKTLAYLKRYAQMLGAYPYKRFSIVENRLPTGFAMPTFTLLGQAVIRLPFIPDTSLRHEVLHAWFGNSIKIDHQTGNWAEGLTTYLADHAFAEEKMRGAEYRKEQLLKYQSYVSSDNAITLSQFAGSKSHLDSHEQKIRAIGYGKAALFFHMLKNALGEERFITGLKNFYGKMKHKRAGWSDLLTSFEENSQTAGLADLFHHWLEHPDIPDLTAQKIQVLEKEGQPTLSFTLHQENDPPYILDVPIVVTTPKETIRETVHLGEQSQHVEIPLSALPTELAIDPDYDLMRHLLPDELPPVWSRFAGAAQKLVVTPSGEGIDRFAPLLEIFKAMGCKISEANAVTDEILSEAAVVFLDPAASDTARSLFAKIKHPATGLTVDIRRNPLNRVHVAVLISTSDIENTEKATAKLKHYGKYSYLHFEDGRILEKRIQPTDVGQIYKIDEPPVGIAVKETLDFDSIIKRLADKQVVYVGESHTRYEDHQLQLRVIRALYEQNPKLAIGMEMFTRPTQAVLDEYLVGRIDEKTFLKESHYFKRWGYDYRLYRDIINFARRQQIPVVALNLEKELVSKVFKKGGISALSPEEQQQLPVDRDLDMPGYQDRIGSVFQMHGSRITKSGQFRDFLQSQALWDETMAESVADHLILHPEQRIVVIAGQGHMAKDSAIPPRVARRISVNQAVIVNAEGNTISPLVTDYALFLRSAELPPRALLGVMLEDNKEGVVIANLKQDGPAGRSGIKKKDLILSFSGEPVSTIEDIKIAMLDKKKGETVRLRIRRPHSVFADEILDFNITL